MRVSVQSELPTPIDAAWGELCQSRLLCDLSRPWITFHALDPPELPEMWSEDATLRVKLRLLGVFPLGVRTFRFERVDSEGFEIRTVERDALIRSWRHQMHLQPVTPTTTRYVDAIEIEAGLLTLPAWLFAHAFYRHRQRRWKRALAKQRAAGS